MNIDNGMVFQNTEPLMKPHITYEEFNDKISVPVKIKLPNGLEINMEFKSTDPQPTNIIITNTCDDYNDDDEYSVEYFDNKCHVTELNSGNVSVYSKGGDLIQIDDRQSTIVFDDNGRIIKMIDKMNGSIINKEYDSQNRVVYYGSENRCIRNIYKEHTYFEISETLTSVVMTEYINGDDRIISRYSCDKKQNGPWEHSSVIADIDISKPLEDRCIKYIKRTNRNYDYY